MDEEKKLALTPDVVKEIKDRLKTDCPKLLAQYKRGLELLNGIDKSVDQATNDRELDDYNNARHELFGDKVERLTFPE